MSAGVLVLPDAIATELLGRVLGPLLRAGDAVALFGDLGAGKTSLARGALAALGLAEEAPSPTFAIVQPYAPPEVTLPVAHVDLYRIDEPGDAAELGLDELREDGALLVEWPERLGDALWPDALRLTLRTIIRGVMMLVTAPPGVICSTPAGPGPPGGFFGHSGMVSVATGAVGSGAAGGASRGVGSAGASPRAGVESVAKAAAPSIRSRRSRGGKRISRIRVGGRACLPRLCAQTKTGRRGVKKEIPRRSAGSGSSKGVEPISRWRRSTGAAAR